MKIKFISIVFYIIFCLNSNLLSDENSKILKVGLLAPLSGPYIEIGNSLLNSLQLALEEINDKNVVIVPRDSGFNNEEKISLAINDLKKVGVKIIIGPTTFEEFEQVVGKFLIEAEELTRCARRRGIWGHRIEWGGSTKVKARRAKAEVRKNTGKNRFLLCQ